MVFSFRLLDWLPVIVKGSEFVNGKFKLYYCMSELYELIGITMFGLIMLVVPVLAYSSAFCDDYSSNYLTYVLTKTSKTQYCTNTVIACAISAFLCVFVGELMVSIGISCVTSFYNPLYDTLEHALLMGITRIILLGLEGAFYSVVTMMLSVFTRNKFVIYTTPLILYFFFMYFGSNILNISTKINPAYVFRNYILGEGNEIGSILYSLVYLIVMMFIAVRVMEKKIERCY